MITRSGLQRKMEEIHKSRFFNISLSPMENQDKALSTIEEIIHGVTKQDLLTYDPHSIMICTIRILFYYEKHLAVRENICDWKRRRKVRTAKDCYDTLLKIFLPHKPQQVIKAVVEVIYQDRLWKYETFCFDIIQKLLDNGAGGALITHIVWDKVESPYINNEDTRTIIRILYECLDTYTWPETQETVSVIERILKLYYVTLLEMQSSRKIEDVTGFKKGLELCIRNIVKHLSNEHNLLVIHRICSWTIEAEIHDKVILQFSGILEHIAYIHHTELYEKTLTPLIFPVLMQMIQSQSKIISLLGNRVMQYLIDRNNNKSCFDTVKIFFENTQFDLRLAICRKEDKMFFKIHREIVHESLLKSVINHNTSRMNLECTFCTICLIAVEIPCGFTAAAIVCLAMNMQDIALHLQNDIYPEATYHIHATVIAIMSLLCWIHNAKVFYNYINKIMMERANWAPHLNPPLQSQYNHAVHHVLWNKTELFFVDWETRYGLWKCFRLRESQDHIRFDNQHIDLR